MANNKVRQTDVRSKTPGTNCLRLHKESSFFHTESDKCQSLGIWKRQLRAQVLEWLFCCSFTPLPLLPSPLPPSSSCLSFSFHFALLIIFSFFLFPPHPTCHLSRALKSTQRELFSLSHWFGSYFSHFVHNINHGHANYVAVTNINRHGWIILVGRAYF